MKLTKKERALLRKLVEESGELIQAAMKLLEHEDEAARKNFSHELADVDALSWNVANRRLVHENSYTSQYKIRADKAARDYGTGE